MDASRYRAPTFGTAQREPGNKWAFTYFLPTHIPRELELTAQTVSVLSEADSALGYLQGLGHVIRDPDLLIGPFLTAEAVASSRIEGTRASLSDVLKAEQDAPTDKKDDIDEVVRYLQATQRGLELIKSLPLTQRLITDVHRVLMSGVRGEERQPGEIRKSPVWIGSGAHSIEDATYVAPIPDHLPDLLTDWEKYVNEPSRTPSLVKCALMHYQFETIHPFLDGNGRIGRLLVGLMLITESRLETPLLYLSGYLESHRSEYYDRLQAVRERGEVQEWLQFFLRAVKAQADDAVSRARKLISLREKYQDQSSKDRSRVSALITLLFRNPFISVNEVHRAVGGSLQGARDLLTRAESYGWVKKYAMIGRGGRTLWIADEIYNILDAPSSYA